MSLIVALAIPPEVVTFREMSYPRALSHTLDNGPGIVQGGWLIQNADSAGCTLGFAALTADSTEAFVTNSHCTVSDHELDGGYIFQPRAFDYLIGQEMMDPDAHTCGYPGFEDACRSADAALIDAAGPIQLGTIARTTNRVGSEGVSGAVTIDHQNPTLTITSRIENVYENEELDKIGQTTGWTYGGVEDTCDDVELTDGWVRQCSDRVDFHASYGDSGAPVFDLKSDGTVELRGIMFGGAGWPYNDTWMSDLGQIQNDLGQLTVHVSVVNAAIIGPTEVPEHAACAWQASVGGGSPPYTYEWHRDNVLVSTSYSYALSDTGTSDFHLELQVTDSGTGTDEEDIWVDVDGSSQTFC